MGVHECRHIFEDKRYVEEYRVEDVEGELGLDRNALIRMALLLGRCSFPGCCICPHASFCTTRPSDLASRHAGS